MSYFTYVKMWNSTRNLPWREAISEAKHDYHNDKNVEEGKNILTQKLPRKIVGILRKPQKKEKEQFKQSKKRMLTLLDPKSSRKIVLKAAPYFSKKESKKAVKDIFGEDLYEGKDSPSAAHRPIKRKPLGIEKSSKVGSKAEKRPFPSSKRISLKKRKPLGIEKSSKKKPFPSSKRVSLQKKREKGDPSPLTELHKLKGVEKKIQDLDDEEIEIYRDAYSKYFRPNPNENMKQRAVSLLKKIGEKKKESAYELEGAIVRYDIQLKKNPDLQDVVIAIVNKEAELGLIIPEF